MLKKLFLCFAAGLTALSLGLGIFYAGEFVVSIFQTKETAEVEVPNNSLSEKETIASLDPIPVEDLIYPKPAAKVETEEQESDTIEPNNGSVVEAFDPTGEYYLIGGANKGFQNLDSIHIGTMNYIKDTKTDHWTPESITPEGYTYNEAGKKLKFARLFVSEKLISFETESENGISYRFEGKFVKEKEVEYNGETDYASIEGILIKLKNGEEIVRRIAHYGYILGC